MRPTRPIRAEQLRLFDTPARERGRTRAHGRRTRRRSAPVRSALTLVALGIATSGIVAGSFAAWSAQTANPGNAVTAGTLTMSNDKAATSVFSASNVKPGDTGVGTVTVANTGSLPMSVRLTQDQLASTGIESSLRLSIHDDTRDWCVYPSNSSGSCASRGAWNASATLTSFALPATSGAAQWPSGQSHTFTLSWELLGTSPNTDQGQTGSFRLVWDGLQ
jgi:hypothetical protein